MRANKGGRPRNAELSISQLLGGNVQKGVNKARRQEIRGPVQLKIVDELCTLAKGFGESAQERTEFWQAAKPIVGDLGKNRKRIKKMIREREEIAERVEATKAGVTTN